MANGQIEMFVGLDPIGLNENSDRKYLWKTKSDQGLAQLEVQTSDDNFFMATFYYIYIKADSGENVIMSLKLK